MADRTELLEVALDSLLEGLCAAGQRGPDHALEPGGGGDYRLRQR